MNTDYAVATIGRPGSARLAAIAAICPVVELVHGISTQGWLDYMPLFKDTVASLPPGMYQGARLPRNHMKNKREAMRRRK